MLDRNAKKSLAAYLTSIVIVTVMACHPIASKKAEVNASLDLSGVIAFVEPAIAEAADIAKIADVEQDEVDTAEISVTDEIEPVEVSEPSVVNETPAVSAEAAVDAQPSYNTFYFGDGDVIHCLVDYYAHDCGLVNEYEPGFYVAHSTTKYGEMIHSMEIGDHVYLEGVELVVIGFDTIYTGEMIHLKRLNSIGCTTTCFQTCYSDGSDLSKIVITERVDGVKPDFINTMIIYENGATYEQTFGHVDI